MKVSKNPFGIDQDRYILQKLMPATFRLFDILAEENLK